jgi:hypothetical protein
MEWNVGSTTKINKHMYMAVINLADILKIQNDYEKMSHSVTMNDLDPPFA